MTRVALLVPDMPVRDELAPYLDRIDAGRWYTNFGPLVRQLEGRLAASFHGEEPPVAVTVANATVGLELALRALALPPGARVLVPALTFVASAASISAVGLTPVLCDVDEASWLLTPDMASALVRKWDIAAVMPVSTYGCPQDARAWDDFSASTGVPVVLDAAGAFGNQASGQRICTVFSLHATKVLAAGEGGFAACADSGMAESIRTLSNFGIDAKGMVQRPGTNAKLSEYHAAVALAALDGWPARRSRRVELHRRYLARLRAWCPRLRLQARPENGVYSILPVLLPEGVSAVAVGARMAAKGIETRRWYCPTIEQHPAFQHCPVAGELRMVPMLNERLLAIPFHVFLTDGEMEAVCRQLAGALG
jgi:dTDP-4-amino-4,6-dideoxygalactose transaminase